MKLPSSETPSPLKTNDWKELFDVVICSAQKPSFFSSKIPFRKWNVKSNRPLPSPVTSIQSTDILVHGSVDALKKFDFWKDAEILYVGDNLGADLIQAKKMHGWHTALIINELDREIEIQSSVLFHELHFLRSTLRNVLTEIQLAMFSSREIKNTFMYPMSSFASNNDDNEEKNRIPIDLQAQSLITSETIVNNNTGAAAAPTQATSQTTAENQQKISEFAQHISHFSAVSYEENSELLTFLENELQSINTELSLLFNPQFGSMFRTDGHTSLYAYEIRRYADIYMSEVSHFLHYSPSHRFYPPHALHMVRICCPLYIAVSSLNDHFFLLGARSGVSLGVVFSLSIV